MSTAEIELLPEDKVWLVDTTDYKGEPKLEKLLVCPNLACGNADVGSMVIYSTDLDTSKWYGEDPGGPPATHMPTFDYGKSVHVEGSDEPDYASCQECGTEWEVSSYTHFYEFN